MTFKIVAATRTEKGEKIRTKTALPAVVYGMGGPAASVTLNYEDFAKLYEQAGEASLIDLFLGDKADGKVLIQDIAYDPVSDRMVHVDLRRIDMNKEMTATVELRFTGESPVIKAQGGTLMRNLESVEVKCLPKDLVSHIDVDLNVLNTFDDVIKIKNLTVPAGITITSPHAEDLVAKATAALTEEEIKAMEAASAPVDLSKIETAGKKKEEAEEGAEEGKPAAAEKEEKKEEKK
ncbi:MAG TPA: 50S ribosomal protein L25 [Candidatus Udaeobacter sp.]|nr:50S ribosomal protein L25 [Candidatus Udaeobacter sp.]